MKKILAMIISVAIVFALAGSAWAAEVTGDLSKNVTASYTPTVKYTVTVSSAENGSVTATPSEAAAGTEIDLTISPSAGFELDTLTVKDAENNDVTVNTTDYSFVMPASNVTVTATFKATIVPTYSVIIAEGIKNGSVITDLTEAAEGVEITLTVTPADGYELDTLTVGGTDVASSVVGGKYTFYMGNANVEVTATFKAIDYTVTIDPDITNGSVTADKYTANIGDTVTLTVTPATGYELRTLTVSAADGSAVTVSDKTFTMPASNVTVKASFTELPVSSVEISWGSMAFTYTDESGAWANDGTEGAGTVTVKNTGNTTVTAKAEYKQADDYTEISGSISPANQTLTAGESVSFTLTLSGKPDAAITAGTKIGEVTITIE